MKRGGMVQRRGRDEAPTITKYGVIVYAQMPTGRSTALAQVPACEPDCWKSHDVSGFPFFFLSFAFHRHYLGWYSVFVSTMSRSILESSTTQLVPRYRSIISRIPVTSSHPLSQLVHHHVSNCSSSNKGAATEGRKGREAREHEHEHEHEHLHQERTQRGNV